MSKSSLNPSPAISIHPVFSTPANVRVYADHRPQDEPSIAVNPLNTNNIVIGYNDYTPLKPNPPIPGISTTATGGGTPADWTYRGGLPGGGSLNSQYAPLGDPVLAFDSSGNLYYVALTGNLNLNVKAGEVFVRRSTDGGATYPTISVISSVTGYTSDHDKPSVAIDTSRSPNRIYVAWTNFNFGLWGAITVAYADVTPWTPSSWTLTTTTVDGTQGVISPDRSCCQGSAIAIGPNGEVYVALYDSDDSIRVAVSTNHGVTFSTPTTVDSSVTQFPSDSPCPIYYPECIPNTDIRTNTFPQIAVDTSSSSARGAIYVAWADYSSGNGDIWISKSTNGGSTWSSRAKVNDDVGSADQFFPALAVHPSNGKIFLIFYDRRYSISNYEMNAFYAFALPSDYPNFTNGLLSSHFSSPDVLKNWGFLGDYIGAAVSSGLGSTFDVAWTDLRDGSTSSHNDDSNIYFARFDPDNPSGNIPWIALAPWYSANHLGFNGCWSYQTLSTLCNPFVATHPFMVTIPIYLIGSTNDTISLSVTGLPAGVNGTFSQGSGIPPFRSNLTLSNGLVGGGTSPGHYTVMVDASNGTLMQPSDFTFDATSGPFIVMDHLYVRNGENVTVFGEGFQPGRIITLTLSGTQLPERPVTDTAGSFSGQFQIQNLPSSEPLDSRVIATDGVGNTANNTLTSPYPPNPENEGPRTPSSSPVFPRVAVLLVVLTVSILGVRELRKRNLRERIRIDTRGLSDT